MSLLDNVAQTYVVGLANARDNFVALGTALRKEHPRWRAGDDARLNIVAKPANLILSAIVNLRLTQHAAAHPQFWSTRVAPELNTEAIIAAPLFELQTFYRFGFFQFLMSSLEHGFRAMQPVVVEGVDGQADQAYWKIYTSLFKAALPSEAAGRHINLFSFLAALRNTIHNNGVYYPLKHVDAAYEVGGKRYELQDGQRVEFFGWEHFIEWLPLISDLASFPIPGVDYHLPPA